MPAKVGLNCNYRSKLKPSKTLFNKEFKDACEHSVGLAEDRKRPTRTWTDWVSPECRRTQM